MAIDTSLLISSPTLQDILVDKDGQLLSAGVVTFYEEDQVTLKNWYYQIGTYPNYTYAAGPNPMVLSAAGTFVDVNGNDIIPFFYPYVESGPNQGNPQPYFITVYNSNGQFQFSRDNFPLVSGGVTPPGPINNGPFLENYIVNNRFWRNIGSVNVSTIATSDNSGTWTTQYASTGTYYFQKLCPDQHDGFSMPDFNYVKNQNGNTTDTIVFNKFTASVPPTLTLDVQPEYYITFNSAGDTSGATLKAFQFPISLHLATLAGQSYSFTIQAQAPVATNAQITVSIYQFCGTGNVSPIPLLLETIPLSNAWQRYVISEEIFQLAAGSSTSSPTDDAYYLQIGMPTGPGTSACTINFALPSIYLDAFIKSTTPINSFQTYDQIDSIITTPRTGDIRTGYNAFWPFGWVPMNGGTIAAVNSVTPPTNNILTYGASDAWPLFRLLWNKFSPYNNGTTNLLAQMYNSSGAAVAYGASAVADFKANMQIAVTNFIGKVLMGAVPMLSLPITYNSTFTASQLVTSGVTLSGTYTAGQGPGVIVNATSPVAFGEVIQFTSGTVTNTNVTLNTDYWCIPISATQFYIASSLANAQNGVYVSVGTGAGSGLVITTRSLVLTMTNAATALNVYKGQPITFSTTGTLPTGITASNVYYAVPTGNVTTAAATICVATTFANAISGTLIAYTNAGSITNTVSATLAGTIAGEYAHAQNVSELAQHQHPGYQDGSAAFVSQTGAGNYTSGGSFSKPSTSQPLTGASLPANITQPGVFSNMFIKL